MHQPIHLQNVGLSFPHKTCFEGLSTHIHYGQRIALTGRNGSGKSTFLRILQGLIAPSEGAVHIPSDVVYGYVPQVIEGYNTLSGGQRFQAHLTQALAQGPNILCLDEPTNHLDLSNRQSLMRLLKNFQGTLIIASHDVELLRTCIDTIWHIEAGQIHFFAGGYDAFIDTCQKQKEALQARIHYLDQEKKQNHLDLMQEQQRAKKRKIQGEKKYQDEKLELRAKQAQGAHTTGRNKQKLRQTKEQLLESLQNLRLPEVIKPKFNLIAADFPTAKAIISISEGSCGYERSLLHDINLQVGARERVAIAGDNGSGKTTLLKAMLADPVVKRIGTWNTPKTFDMGYMDQHYTTLPADLSVFAIIEREVPQLTIQEIRQHLNDFLFRKNEETMVKVNRLSGGEKARLSLAQIAARPPKVLILDEITNNLDLETREHVIQVIKDYPGAIMVISHDLDFLNRICIDTYYVIKQGRLYRK